MPSTTGPNICIIWSFSPFPKKFSCSLRSLDCMDMQHYLQVQLYFFLPSLIVSFQSALKVKTHVKLHKSAYKCPHIVCGQGILRPCSRLRIGSDAPTQNVLSAGTLPWTRWESLYSVPHDPLQLSVEGSGKKERREQEGYIEGSPYGKSQLCR